MRIRERRPNEDEDVIVKRVVKHFGVQTRAEVFIWSVTCGTDRAIIRSTEGDAVDAARRVGRVRRRQVWIEDDLASGQFRRIQ